jgi:hypothetical protein
MTAMSTIMPKRVQLRRTKGWRKPEGTVSVARPTRWGNPFKAGDVADPVAEFRSMLLDPNRTEDYPPIAQVQSEFAPALKCSPADSGPSVSNGSNLPVPGRGQETVPAALVEWSERNPVQFGPGF